MIAIFHNDYKCNIFIDDIHSLIVFLPGVVPFFLLAVIVASSLSIVVASSVSRIVRIVVSSVSWSVASSLSVIPGIVTRSN